MLSVLTTNQKGAVAETAVAKAAIELGIGVFRPYGDERYDLIFDLRPRLVRVQCKWASCDGRVIYARLYSCRRARAGLVRTSYRPGGVDAFALYCPNTERCYWLEAGEVGTRTEVMLRLTGTKNNQSSGVNWARAYEFAARLESSRGAVAQLGERLAGSQKVRGSIPLGSIAA